MFKGMKKKMMLTALAVLAIGNVMSVSAATTIDVNWAEYTGYVKKWEDFVTEPLTKTTLGDATNRPIFIQDGAALCSWVNNRHSMKITKKVDYDSSGPLYMEYTKTIDLTNTDSFLSTTMTISTQALEFRTTYTDGLWSPDTF